MSYYEDERRRQHRPTKQRRDSYDDESAYTPRETPRSSGALVKRRDSYDSVDEEVKRDFSPGRGGYYKETITRKRSTRPARARSFDDDDDDRYDDDRSHGGNRHRSGRYDDDRRDRRSRRYSSEYSSRSRSRTPPRHKDRERRKSQSEKALEAIGLGGLAATLLGKKEHDRSRSRDREHGSSRGRARSEDRYESRRRSRSRGGPSKDQMTQAIKAAVLAGAGEAFRARKEPGGWTGEKGKRILTAAAAAGGLDGLISHGKGEDEHKTRNTIGSAIAGIATSRIVNGPRSKSRGRAGSPDSRGGRSRSRGGVGDVLAGSAVAVGAKKAYDSMRGRSSSRGRGRSRSASSYGSRSPPRESLRRSLSRGAAKGLAAVGLTSQADKLDPDRRRSDRHDDYDSRYDGRGYDNRDYYRDDVGAPRSGFSNDVEHTMGAPRTLSRSQSAVGDAERQGTPSYSLDYGARHNGDPETDSDSDLGSSSGEEKERKRGKRKTLLTTGLAAVATIHAGHSVYQSYEKRHARQKAVREGTISTEQARMNRNRDRLQDAASIGLAALGIKGAYSEFKEMKEAREEFKEKKETIERHRAKRAARREKYRQLGYSDAGDDYSLSMPDLHAPQPMHPPQYNEYDQGGRPYIDPRQAYGPSPLPMYDGHGPYSTGAMPPPGPLYFDDNPYGSQPPPPTGGQIPIHSMSSMPPSRNESSRQLMTPPSSSPSNSPVLRGRDPGPTPDPRQNPQYPHNPPAPGPSQPQQYPLNPQTNQTGPEGGQAGYSRDRTPNPPR